MQDAVLYRDLLLQLMAEPVVQDFGLSRQFIAYVDRVLDVTPKHEAH
jgi:hypothetical protein